MRISAIATGALLLVPSTALADGPEASVPRAPLTSNAAPVVVSTRAGGPVNLSGGRNLARIADSGARADKGAGSTRAIEIASAAAAATERPVAGPRMLTRMNVAGVLGALDAALQECGGRAAPTPAARIGLRISVTPAGAVESADPVGPAPVHADVLACVVSVITAARFRAPGAAPAAARAPRARGATPDRGGGSCGTCRRRDGRRPSRSSTD